MAGMLVSSVMTNFFGGVLGSSARDDCVIVTGASRGIGERIAKQYAKQGARLVLAARGQNELEETAKACREAGAREVKIKATDITNDDQCRDLVQFTMQEYGKVDTLVLNAGVAMPGKFGEASDADRVREVMSTNFMGAVYPVHHALPHLKKSRGRIVVISSVAGFVPCPHLSMYAASKYALRGFFDSLRMELAGTGVSITVCYPGFVSSETTVARPLPKGDIAKPEKPAPKPMFSFMNYQFVWVGPILMPFLSPDECARQVVAAAQTRLPTVVVPWWFNFQILADFAAPAMTRWVSKMVFTPVMQELYE